MLPQEAPRLHCLYTNINLCFLRFHDLISLFLESGNAVLCSPFIMASTSLNIVIKFKGGFEGYGFNLWKVRIGSTGALFRQSLRMCFASPRSSEAAFFLHQRQLVLFKVSQPHFPLLRKWECCSLFSFHHGKYLSEYCD